jgi:hypothetical protein
LRWRARQRIPTSFRAAAERQAARSVGQAESSLLSLLTQTVVLIVFAWLLVTYLLPTLFELSAAPYR